MRLWSRSYPKAQSNPPKPEQSVLKLSQYQEDAMWLFSVEPSVTQTQLCAQTSYSICLKETIE